MHRNPLINIDKIDKPSNSKNVLNMPDIGKGSRHNGILMHGSFVLRSSGLFLHALLAANNGQRSVMDLPESAQKAGYGLV